MNHKIKKLPKNVVEITIEVSIAEMEPHLQKAAQQISQTTTIPGFRPGKASFDQVRINVGIGRIWEEAAQIVVPKAYQDVIKEEGFDSIGSPVIAVEKLAPDNAFIFKATVPLMPETTLGDYSTIKVEKKTSSVDNKVVDQTAEDLRKMQTKEVIVNRPVKASGDKVVVDMGMSLDNVPIDGGSTKDHSIYMDENYYIPGLKEQLHDVKKGDVKNFKLPFPKEHPQKMIAGKDVDFQITVKEVYDLQMPELDDAFAKTIGQSSLKELKELIRGNLEKEAQVKENQRQEIELLEKMIEKTTFGDIPELLINEESHKMLSELEHNVAKQGMEFNEYLGKINKTSNQLRLDFAPDAVKRVKIAIAVRKIGEAQKIEVPEQDIDEEVKRMLEVYKDSPDQYDQIKSKNAREYLRIMLLNRKVIEWLRGQAGLDA